MKKGDKWVLELVAWIGFAIGVSLLYLILNSCSKPNLLDGDVRNENCICSEEAQKTNSDVCKQVCYFLR